MPRPVGLVSVCLVVEARHLPRQRVIENEAGHWLRENVYLAHHNTGNYQTSQGECATTTAQEYVLHRITRVGAEQCVCVHVCVTGGVCVQRTGCACRAPSTLSATTQIVSGRGR